jgi:hypothetical protein
VVQPAGGPERAVLAHVRDADVGELALRLAHKRRHDAILVEPDHDNVRETGHLGERVERVPDHGLELVGGRRWPHLAADGEEGLGAWCERVRWRATHSRA